MVGISEDAEFDFFEGDLVKSSVKFMEECIKKLREIEECSETIAKEELCINKIMQLKGFIRGSLVRIVLKIINSKQWRRWGISLIKLYEDEDPELAEEIKRRMFVFEDIVMLDDRTIQKVMSKVNSQELAKALKSVDTEVQDKVFRNLSKRAVSMLKEDMEYMGPVKLKDVEEAQQLIVSIIMYLEYRGEIIIPWAEE
jgi:flagellar motor switch protein FliG